MTLDPSRENQKMKISNIVLFVAFAGLCLNQASAQGVAYPPGSAASRSIGDSSAALRPAHFNSARSLSDASVDFAAAQNQGTPSEPALTQGGDSGYPAVSFDAGPSDNYAGSSYTGNYGSNRSSQVWFSSETLLWFTRNVSSPALVNTSSAGIAPVTGVNGVKTVFGGGDGIDYGLAPGFRISGGMYFGDEQKVGIGGRTYGLFDPTKTYRLASDGSGTAGNPPIGLPLYDLSTNSERAYTLGATAAGTVDARSDLDMYGSDGSLYLLLTRSDSMRMDLLGGYSYNLLRNSIGVETTSAVIGDPVTNDLFATKNTFNGGHLGVLSSVDRSRVSFSTLAKIAFGNMHQTGSIRGYSIVSNTPLGAGIYAQPSNIGEYERDTFAFIPELNLKLGFAASQNVQFTVGYTMMMWSGVALAGSQIDNAIDPTQLVLPLTAGTRPNPMFPNNEAFWMQGVDLGLNITF